MRQLSNWKIMIFYMKVIVKMLSLLLMVLSNKFQFLKFISINWVEDALINY